MKPGDIKPGEVSRAHQGRAETSPTKEDDKFRAQVNRCERIEGATSDPLSDVGEKYFSKKEMGLKEREYSKGSPNKRAGEKASSAWNHTEPLLKKTKFGKGGG